MNNVPIFKTANFHAEYSKVDYINGGSRSLNQDLILSKTTSCIDDIEQCVRAEIVALNPPDFRFYFELTSVGISVKDSFSILACEPIESYIFHLNFAANLSLFRVKYPLECTFKSFLLKIEPTFFIWGIR